MDAELKSKWVAALRSGKYQQGRQVLRSFDGFCCLGVLCDITKEGKWQMTEGDPKPQYFYSSENFGTMDSMLEDTYADSIGISEAEQELLAAMNDGAGDEPTRSFAEIADYIEANM